MANHAFHGLICLVRNLLSGESYSLERGPGRPPCCPFQAAKFPTVFLSRCHDSFAAWPSWAYLILIVYELISGSGLSWHAFGFKFFARSEWDPVNEQFGALPFIYGTLVSSLVALIIAVPLAVGVAVFTTEMCPSVLRGSAVVFRGIAGGDSQRDLRPVGDVCSDADLERLRRAVSVKDSRAGLGCLRGRP